MLIGERSHPTDLRRPPSPLGIRLPSLLFLSSQIRGGRASQQCGGGEAVERIRTAAPPRDRLPPSFPPDPRRRRRQRAVEGVEAGGGESATVGEVGAVSRPMTSMAVAAGSGGAAANSRFSCFFEFFWFLFFTRAKTNSRRHKHPHAKITILQIPGCVRAVHHTRKLVLTVQKNLSSSSAQEQVGYFKKGFSNYFFWTLAESTNS